MISAQVHADSFERATARRAAVSAVVTGKRIIIPNRGVNQIRRRIQIGKEH
jgi:hypothetical protein